MKPKRKRSYIVAGVFLTGVLCVVGLLLPKSRPVQSGFSVGTPLAPGRVKPQLVSTSFGAFLLAPDGSLWTWGGTYGSFAGCFGEKKVVEVPQRVGSDHDWRKISANSSTLLALKADGTLWGWGWHYSKQRARRSGLTLLPSPTRIGHDRDWAEVTVGAGHCLALKTDGSLWAWGQNDHGQLGDSTTNNKFAPAQVGLATDWGSIAAGTMNSFALKRNGTIWGWGLDLRPPPGRLVHDQPDLVDTLTPCQLDPNTNWVTIAPGMFFLLALSSDGTLWIGGQNARSVVREDSVSPSSRTLTQVGERTNWAQVYAGGNSFFARKTDGRWFAGGGNLYQQLGLDKNGIVASPERLFLDAEPWAFSTGDGNTLLLAKDGTVWTWGKRHGSDRSPAIIKLKQKLNPLLQRLPWHPHPLSTELFSIDSAPFKLWELPYAVRRSLGKERSHEGAIKATPTQ